MMARPDSGPDLEKVNVPALVLVGEQDALTPLADAERLHARMSRSILTVIPEAGHLANVERPTEFTRALHQDALGLRTLPGEYGRGAVEADEVDRGDVERDGDDA